MLWQKIDDASYEIFKIWLLWWLEKYDYWLFSSKTHFQHIFNLKHIKKHSINLVKQIHNLKKQNKPL
jgi:hypothetical protein